MMMSDPLSDGGLSACTHYDPTDLFDLLDGLLPEASPERTQLIDHVCGCRACQLELRAATSDTAFVDHGAGADDVRAEQLVDVVREAARARLVELWRELFATRLREADVHGRVLAEVRPRGAREVAHELDELAPRLRALGPSAVAEPAGREPAQASAQDALDQLARLGDHAWQRFGQWLLDELAGRPSASAASLAGPVHSALGRSARLARGRQALADERPHRALAEADELLAVRADDLLALGLRLAARARLGDSRAFRRAAARFADVEARHPNRRLRSWVRGRLGSWSRRLAQRPRLVAGWLGLSAHGAAARASEPFPLVMPAAHGRAWSPGTFGEPFHDDPLADAPVDG